MPRMIPVNTRMLPGESDADFCRRMGWGPGTSIVGDEGYGPTTLEITAVGREKILAAKISDKERNWTLQFRDWKEVCE